MPLALFVIQWDAFEGALVTHKFPGDIDIRSEDVQTIQVAHQFNQGSSWFIIEDQEFKGVSYYDDKAARSLVLSLKVYETPYNYVKFLTALAGFILARSNDEISARLEEAFSMVQAEVPPGELMILNLTEQLAKIEDEKLDSRLALEAIMRITPDPQTKVLIYLLVHKESSLDAMTRQLDPSGVGTIDVKSVVVFLETKGYITLDKTTGLYRLSHAFEHLGY